MKDLKLTVYDFDDTIYNGDSSIRFWWFLLAKRPLYILLAPYFLLLILLHGAHILSRDKFKQAIYIPINKVPQPRVKTWVTEFWDREKGNINPWFKRRLTAEKKKGLIPVCISASPRFLLDDIVKELGIPHLICTELVTRDDTITNRISGSNCRGREKVRRLNKWALEQSKSYTIEKFASDSKADLPLYMLAREKYLVHKGNITTGTP